VKAALVFPRTRYPSGDPPLGVAYLAAALRERTGSAPVVIDTTFSDEPMDLVERELGKERFDLVGISSMVTMAGEGAEVARIARRVNRGALILMGGPHPTTLPEQALKEEAVDAVCAGEGEDTITEVALKGGIEGVAGIYTRSGEGGVSGRPRPPIADLDSLPFPALDLLPMNDYLDHWFQLEAVDPAIRGTSVLATRGCPFRCAYCQPTLDKLFGKGVRKRSAKNVADELELRIKQFEAGGFLFADDTFIADRRWVRGFCDELVKRDLGLAWGCNVRADLVDSELLAEMRNAGLSKIYVGVEVYDDARRREVFNKGLTREQVEAAIRAAKNLGILTQGYFMLGAPGESRADVWDTVRYAWRLPLDDATFNLTTPLPATYLYERHRGLISVSNEELDYYRRYAFAPANGVSQEWLSRVQKAAYAGFYARPGRLARQVRGALTSGGLRRLASKLRRVV